MTNFSKRAAFFEALFCSQLCLASAHSHTRVSAGVARLGRCSRRRRPGGAWGRRFRRCRARQTRCQTVSAAPPTHLPSYAASNEIPGTWVGSTRGGRRRVKWHRDRSHRGVRVGGRARGVRCEAVRRGLWEGTAMARIGGFDRSRSRSTLPTRCEKLGAIFPRPRLHDRDFPSSRSN